MKKRSVIALAAGLAAAPVAIGQWSENFESYGAGPISGQGGWSIWCTGGTDMRVDDTGPARSGTKALVGNSTGDVVQEFVGIDSGQWTITVWVYVPSNAGGTGTRNGWVNLMNTYCVIPQVNQHWSTATTFSLVSGQVRGWANSGFATLITDQWVEYRCEIDFDNDTFEEYYDGQLFVGPRQWSSNVAPGGAIRLQAINLYAENIDGIRFDDLSVTSGAACYPDCDTSTGPGVLDIFDFLCFGNRFSANDPYACDCDVSTGPGVCDIFDFLCFGNAFNAGCP